MYSNRKHSTRCELLTAPTYNIPIHRGSSMCACVCFTDEGNIGGLRFRALACVAPSTVSTPESMLFYVNSFNSIALFFHSCSGVGVAHLRSELYDRKLSAFRRRSLQTA